MHELESIFEDSKQSVMANLRQSLLIKKKWPQVAGDVLSKELSVSFVKKGLLVLECSNPCWVNEIQFYEEDLLKNINKLFQKKKGIEKIKIVHGKKSTNRFA